MKVFIRTLTVNDVENVYAVETKCFKSPWSFKGLFQDIVLNPCSVYIGALDEKENIIGYAGMWVVMNEAHITNIAVLPQKRGQGIGRQLLEKLIALAKNLNAAKITLEVRPSNTVAINLYEAQGFQKDGIYKGYYTDDGEDAQMMWLMLAPNIANA